MLTVLLMQELVTRRGLISDGRCCCKDAFVGGGHSTRVDEKLFQAGFMLDFSTFLLVGQYFLIVGLDLPFVFLETLQINLKQR